jgi:hypothetical protein
MTYGIDSKELWEKVMYARKDALFSSWFGVIGKPVACRGDTLLLLINTFFC